MVVARSAVMVVVRAKDSAATTEGYRGNGGSGNKDDRKSNSGENGERSGNSGGGASHLYLSYFLFEKIGDSYSLEVATTAHVTLFFFSFFAVSPLLFILFISHPDVVRF